MNNTHFFKTNSNKGPTYRSTALGDGGEYSLFHSPTIRQLSLYGISFNDEKNSFDIDMAVDTVIIDSTASSGSVVTYAPGTVSGTVLSSLNTLFGNGGSGVSSYADLTNKPFTSDQVASLLALIQVDNP